MSLRRRLRTGTAANSANLIYVSVLQLLALPVLTHAWGVESYGIWLMLTTIPTYLALADFGFPQAATSDMAMRIAQSDREGAQRTFQSIWIFVALVSAAAVTFAAVVFLMPMAYSGVLFALVVYSALTQCSRVVLAGFRASGHYARGTLIYDTMVFCEGLTVLLVASLGGGHLACAVGLVASRAIVMGMLYAMLRRTVPWLHLGVADATTDELRRLSRSALAAMAIPASIALNLHGMVVVIGAIISPVAAATFAPVRTISRIGIQLVGALNRASMPEMSAAHATGRGDAMGKILLANVASIAFLVVPGAVLFGIFGGRIVQTWSHGAVHPDDIFITLMAVALVLHAIWYYLSNLLIATNSHTDIAPLLAVTSIVSTVVAIPAAHVGGLVGVAAVLIAAETTNIIIVLGRSRFNRPNFRDQLQSLCSLLMSTVRGA